MIIFGSGALFGTPLTDATGAAIANPTPVQFGTLQDVSADFSFETKLLYGNLQFAVAAGRGKGKASFKAKAANINGALLNSIVFGQTVTAGILNDVNDTTGTLIPATPFQITVVPPGTGVFAADLGVTNDLGLVMTKVAAAPSAGQYSVSAIGVYLFSTADNVAGRRAFINYQYTATSTSAKKIAIQNLPMGYAPSFKCDLYLPFQGKSMVLTLNNCITSKLSFATKLDDFLVPEFDFDALADGNNTLGTMAMSE